MKVLSQQNAFIGIGVTQTHVENATVVRLYNSAATTKTVNVLEYVYPDYNVIGSVSIPAGQVIYVQKKSEQYLAGDSEIYYNKIAYSPVMEYANWSSSDGGGGGIDNTDSDLLLHIDPSNSSSYSGSGSTLTDLSSSSNDGTLESEVNYVSNTNGGVFVFNGGELQQIAFTPITINHTAATVELWARNTSTDNNTIFAIGHHVSNSWPYRTMSFHLPYGGNIYFDGGSGAGNQTYNSRLYQTAPSDITTKWYHWTFVLSTTEQKIFLNGVEWASKGSGVSNGVGTSGTAQLTVINYENEFEGLLGAVRVWKKAFSESDALANFNLDKVKYGY